MSQKIGKVCYNWGVKITRVDILEIVPTPTVQNAMHQQLAAERVKRASVVTAQGHRVQVKTESEGEMQSAITLSKGDQTVLLLFLRCSLMLMCCRTYFSVFTSNNDGFDACAGERSSLQRAG